MKDVIFLSIRTFFKKYVDKLLNRLFHHLFGAFNGSLELYVRDGKFFIIDLRITTRLGVYGFNLLQHELPTDSLGYEADLHKLDDEEDGKTA